VRVGVGDICGTDQRPCLGQFLDHVRVGGKDELPAEELEILDILAVVIHRVVNLQPLFQRQLVVFVTMSGGGMDAAGARLQSDMLAEENNRVAFVEGVPAVFPRQRRCLEGGDNAAAQAGAIEERILQSLGNNQYPFFGVNRHIVELRMHGHCQVGGDGPGGGRPDDNIGFFAGKRRDGGRDIVNNPEPDKDRRRGMIGVFDLCLCQGGDTGRAPVHRFSSPVKAAVMGKFGQLGCGLTFVLIVHRQVGVVPVAEHAEPLELLLLDGDEFLRIVAALTAHFQLGHGVLFRAEVLFHLQFNRQSVAVPPRYIRGMETFHPFALEDQILENLVEGVTDMDMAVGIGRAVVQYIEGFGRPGCFNLSVKVFFIPADKDFRLTLIQVGLHRKVGKRQIQGIFIVHGFPPVGSFRT